MFSTYMSKLWVSLQPYKTGSVIMLIMFFIVGYNIQGKEETIKKGFLVFTHFIRNLSEIATPHALRLALGFCTK